MHPEHPDQTNATRQPLHPAPHPAPAPAPAAMPPRDMPGQASAATPDQDRGVAPRRAGPDQDREAVPILVSRDYSRLRSLARLWLRPDDPVGRALTAKLETCRVVRPDAVPPAIATLGARVVFAVEGRGVPESRVLVMPEEHAEGGRTVPVSTPLGVALLGLAAGQRAETVERDGRRLALHLLAVDRDGGLGGAPPVWPPPRLASQRTAPPGSGDSDPTPTPPSQPPPPLPPMPPSAA